MGQHILHGNPPVPIILRKSARARRISLRISQLDGRVTLTLPKSVSDAEGIAFAREKEDWLRGHLDRRGEDQAVALGAELPVEGTFRAIQSGSGRGVTLNVDTLRVPGKPEQVPTRVQAFLKQMARDKLAHASDHYANRLGKPYTRISIRDTRSRWGSCSSAGALMYSWRLILCPPEVLNYVAAHEVAHLAEMNHSQAFWDTVTRIHGPYSAPRAWLRKNGSSLHTYRFQA
ncbi:MAG: SprT family zinc-dependent metalloprotease [Planktotalea sp.]|uniref:M48 family metallopeptidase n=1 Tax=Planktotalea sp. TaxID=2029877 RepID=UPI003C732D6D